MDRIKSWQSNDSFTVIQATLLILDEDPTGKNHLPNKADAPEGFEGIFSALKDSINRGILNAELFRDWDSTEWSETRVMRDDLMEWLLKRGLRPHFFFGQETTSDSLPRYLDKNHSCYSPKLAAAVRAWEAVTTDPKYVNNKKTAKTNIIKWLNDHAADFGLAKDGKTNTEAIENQIAKVVNWQPEGGAPKTLGG